MDISPAERALLRDLARRVAEIAALPVMAERRELWKRHNGLRPQRPMVLVFPEGSWRELLPADVLRCRTKEARAIEWELRRRIYQHEHLHDDMVIEAQWLVDAVIHSTGWGLEPKWHCTDDPTGARGFDPVINAPADLKKLKFPEHVLDEEATARRCAEMSALLGDILAVGRRGVRRFGMSLVRLYSDRRGLGQAMLDMAVEPGMVHDAIAFFAEGRRRHLQWCVESNLLSLNNDGTYHASGGNGYTDELPAEGFDPHRVRPCDLWASSEAQEMAQVSPEMHEEFALRYERPLLAPFGLNGYGCCEDLTRKLDAVLTIPNLRRVSISPWADVAACAAKLRDKYVFSWKPQPADLCGRFNAQRIRRYIRRTIEAARSCALEIILKDTHTCDHHPERFTLWTKIARELVDAA